MRSVLGIEQIRVRDHNDLARIEVPIKDLAVLCKLEVLEING